MPFWFSADNMWSSEAVNQMSIALHCTNMLFDFEPTLFSKFYINLWFVKFQIFSCYDKFYMMMFPMKITSIFWLDPKHEILVYMFH